MAKTPEQRDLYAEHVVGVQIDTLGRKVWVCVDGACVLRVAAPKVILTDDRKQLQDENPPTASKRLKGKIE